MGYVTFLLCIIITFCIIDYHNFGGLTQQAFVISQFLWAVILEGLSCIVLVQDLLLGCSQAAGSHRSPLQARLGRI